MRGQEAAYHEITSPREQQRGSQVAGHRGNGNEPEHVDDGRDHRERRSDQGHMLPSEQAAIETRRNGGHEGQTGHAGCDQ